MRSRWWARAVLLPVLFLMATGCGDDGAAEVPEDDGLKGVLIDVHREPG